MRTEQNDIDEWFRATGWDKVTNKDGAFYNEREKLLILDAFPRNVLTLESGKIMPFDVVIVRPDDLLMSRLGL